jgi:hypothetical protein
MKMKIPKTTTAGPSGREKRSTPRFAVMHECTWSGASGSAICRLADISVSGCFIHSLSSPAPGAATEVTIFRDAEPPLVLQGLVVYVHREMGFAVRFENNTDEVMDGLRDFVARFAIPHEAAIR